MNKLHVLALTGLIVCGVNNASMGQEQREVLYALHTLGQNFADVPMVVQNIDMFAGVLEMNIQINEAKLKAANQTLKTTLWKSAAMIGGAWVSTVTLTAIGNFISDSLPGEIKYSLSTKFLGGLIRDGIATGSVLNRTFIGLNIYNVWKNRSALMEALALDQEILSKLEEIKVSVDFIEENSDSAENFLLNSAE